MLQQVNSQGGPEGGPPSSLQRGEVAETNQGAGPPPSYLQQQQQQQQEAPLSALEQQQGLSPTDRSHDSTGFSPAAATGAEAAEAAAAATSVAAAVDATAAASDAAKYPTGAAQAAPHSPAGFKGLLHSVMQQVAPTKQQTHAEREENPLNSSYPFGVTAEQLTGLHAPSSEAAAVH